MCYLFHWVSSALLKGGSKAGVFQWLSYILKRQREKQKLPQKSILNKWQDNHKLFFPLSCNCLLLTDSSRHCTKGHNVFHSHSHKTQEDRHRADCPISIMLLQGHTHRNNWYRQVTITSAQHPITAQWEGMGDVGSVRYESALLPPCPTISALSYSNCQRSTTPFLSEF